MTWQSALFLLAVVGWFGLHHWLGKAGQGRLLLPLIAIEFLGFIGLWLYVTGEIEGNSSTGMAGGIFIFGGAALMIAPAILGVMTLWRYRRASASKIKGTTE